MKRLIVVALAFGLAAAAGCGKRDTVETKIKTETDQSGQTVKTEAETAGRLPGGKIDTQNRIYIGVVKDYKAGESLKIETSDGKAESFDLNERSTATTVAPSVKVGSTVEVIVEQSKDQPKKLSVITRG
jgi:hypothetical protein